MKSLVTFLTLSIAMVFTAGCGMSGKAGFERNFTPATAHEFVQYHESLKGATELLGEASYSVALAAGNEQAIAELDVALAKLDEADIRDGNDGLMEAIQAVNAASRNAANSNVSGNLNSEQVAHIQDAYVYAQTAAELNERALHASQNLGTLLLDEIEQNPRAIGNANQVLELLDFSRGALTNQASTGATLLSTISNAAHAGNIELAGPEQIVAMRRSIAPSTLD
ncbi:MAG: hypothetical protein JJU11_01270 [Candidatus Sumerlaeia bacterium]|nr:hypothetical protein [Candidatus Sumerlaeia bacterium]